MITWDQAANLVAFAATFDRRKAGELDIRAWMLVAQQHRWTPAAAERVIAEHYGAGADRPRIEPNAITDRLRAIRRAAAATFDLPRIPVGLPDHEYPAWLRTQRDRHVQALVDTWATTGTEPAAQLPPAPAPHLPGQRRIAAITRSAFHNA